MYEPTQILPVAIAGDTDLIALTIDMIGAEGVAAIGPALDTLRQAGIDPAGDDAQPLLIEAIFQALELLEVNPANALVADTILDLDVAVAETALNMLFIANFPEGSGDPATLGDGTVLLLAALAAAAGKRAEGVTLLREAKLSRPAPRFQAASIQLLLLVQPDAEAAMQLLFEQTLDGVDHPEIWKALPLAVIRFPELASKIEPLLADELQFYTELWGVLHALCIAAAGEPERALKLIEPIATAQSQATMVQGALFHIQSLLNPAHPAHDLESRFCATPFDAFDVIDGSSHLCCASWLPESIGDLAETDWQDVWNSDTAQSIRASILDGSYRFCNKTACPKIAAGTLPTRDAAADQSDRWRDVIENFRLRLATGPQRVNLAYDKTCNLSCPSCRTGKVAADSATRTRFDKLQEEQILPMLRGAKVAFINGSGDPFASKNFRNLLDRLGAEDYPELRFLVMTNGMLFTPREWERFPALHGRTSCLRISLDAATGPTHELLRRGARWPVMEANLAFARDLRRQGLIDRLDFSFTVQLENYQEMGPAIDLARLYSADHVAFGRLTNWGTFTSEQYATRAVFVPSHPKHQGFLAAMRDPRLRDPIAGLNDLTPFLTA